MGTMMMAGSRTKGAVRALIVRASTHIDKATRLTRGPTFNCEKISDEIEKVIDVMNAAFYRMRLPDDGYVVDFRAEQKRYDATRGRLETLYDWYYSHCARRPD